MDPSDLLSLNADLWFSGLPHDAQAALLHQARPIRVGAGKRIYNAGDPPNGLWAVLAGQVRLKGYSFNGVELLALILRPGTWFGELSTLDAGPRPHDAVAFEDSRLLNLSTAAFDSAALVEPILYRHLALLACRHQRTALEFITRTHGQSVRTRVASALSRAVVTTDMRVRLRQEDLAVIVGVSRQALSRHLRAFEREGLLSLGYGELEVLDPGRLRAFEEA